jgi:hypothetical protein
MEKKLNKNKCDVDADHDQRAMSDVDDAPAPSERLEITNQADPDSLSQAKPLKRGAGPG